MEEGRSVKLVDPNDMPEAEQEFERNSKYAKIFEEMVNTGKILVVEESDIEELEKFRRVILEMSKRYVPEDLKLQTRISANVMIARLTEKTERPASLGQLLNRARHKTVSELEKLGVFDLTSGTEEVIRQYLVAKSC